MTEKDTILTLQLAGLEIIVHVSSYVLWSRINSMDLKGTGEFAESPLPFVFRLYAHLFYSVNADSDQSQKSKNSMKAP